LTALRANPPTRRDEPCLVLPRLPGEVEVEGRDSTKDDAKFFERELFTLLRSRAELLAKVIGGFIL